MKKRDQPKARTILEEINAEELRNIGKKIDSVGVIH